MNKQTNLLFANLEDINMYDNMHLFGSDNCDIAFSFKLYTLT